ncbi:hypothetical protein HID58_076831 [Brassica napus]|uniref:Uncharacterized protein n=1 Tax=Brassica napus TaxID=3708 RepID=A0ABQ7YNL5_BRANA|nr:hypothetical protein HID58_076831 [Brassica napus]
MMIQNVPDTSSLDYWLNWRVFLCAVWVLTPMIIALFVIWKFEKDSSVETQRPKGSYSEHSEDIWRPSLKQIHPGWLLGFRVLAFCFLLTSNIVRLAFRGFRIYYYYTQWTFTLITIYFRMGSLFSVYGCFQHKKQLSRRIPIDQTSAGAAVLTDSIYWTVIFPFLSLQDYEMSFLFTFILALTLNIFDSLGHSSLTFLLLTMFSDDCEFAYEQPPQFLTVWFSYFILWTGSFVIFQWLLHVFISVGWPYPFLDLSIPMAPVWYLLVALLHLPSYALYALFVRIKHQFTS